jgi:hypothetical protein
MDSLSSLIIIQMISASHLSERLNVPLSVASAPLKA